MMSIINNKTLEEICKKTSKLIKPCTRCGRQRIVLAVFENNFNNNIRGWVQYCPICDADSDVPIVEFNELDWK